MQLLKPMEKINQSITSSQSHILVIDDEPDIRQLLKEILEDEGYYVEVAKNGKEARQAYLNRQPKLILLDIWMPDVDGISLLKEWIEEGELPIPVIMMSGHGTVETAVEATRLGAFDFIEKPLSLAKLLITVQQALESDKYHRESSIYTRQGLSVTEPIGRSPAMQKLREQIKRIAEHDSWVLIQGEAGSGTKVAAYYLHANSANHDKKLVEINLSAISFQNNPEKFVGSEHNGNVIAGFLDKAQGGSLLLRNIDEADIVTQNFLFGLLQSNSFQHIGSSNTESFRARVICSSYNNLENLVEQKQFRKDLFYLVNVVPVIVPPLREHREDIPDLLNFYTNILVDQEKLPYRRFSLAAQNKLRNYDWLGNIRELTNLIQRLLVTAAGNEINLEEVEKAIHQHQSQPLTSDNKSVTYDLPLREAREKFERDYLIHHLQQTGGSIGQVAKQIGMERTHLYRKLRALDIDPKNILLTKT